MEKLKLLNSPAARLRGVQVLAALAVIGLVDVLYQAGSHARWRMWIARQARALESSQAASTQPAKTETSAKPPELAADLRKRNIFTTPRPTGHGFTLTGVLFDRAMFNRREGGAVTLKEGESAGAVKLKSINGYEVVIEYEGKPQTLKLFDGPGGGGGGGPQMMMSGAPHPRGMPAAPAAPGTPRMRVSDGPALPPGVDVSQLPPEVREQIQSRMRRAN